MELAFDKRTPKSRESRFTSQKKIESWIADAFAGDMLSFNDRAAQGAASNLGAVDLKNPIEKTRDVPPVFNAGRQFTIRSIMIITIIMAVGSAGIGQLWRAANGHVEDIGPFVLVTSMAPLGVMITINWFLRLFRLL